MLVSELIAELQKYQAANGDIEVRYSRTDDEIDELGDDTGDFCLIY